MDAGIPLAAFPAVSESVTKEGVAIRSEVPGLKTKDKNPACIARDIRPVFDSPDLPCAEARLNEIVEKYQKLAPKLASWLEGNLIDGLTVFKLPEHFRRRL
jgi:transposase-like protein